jgi:hypothetical protein
MPSKPVRDPRVDPKVGDVIRGWGKTPSDIRITWRNPHTGRVAFRSAKSCRSETIECFIRMAEKATVIHAAD